MGVTSSRVRRFSMKIGYPTKRILYYRILNIEIFYLKGIPINNVLLVNIEGRVWYTIYHHLPVVKGVSSNPSINQPTNGKRTYMIPIFYHKNHQGFWPFWPPQVTAGMFAFSGFQQYIPRQIKRAITCRRVVDFMGIFMGISPNEESFMGISCERMGISWMNDDWWLVQGSY